MPQLSIIIISFNTKDILRQCLASLYKNTTGLDYEVIVVDNASSDKSPQMIKTKFPNVRLVINKQNLGFGAANNQAVKLAKANHLLLLNSDTIIKDNAIVKTYQQASITPNLGAISSQLLNKDHTIQPSGGYFPKLINLVTWQLGLDDIPLLGNIFSTIIKPVHPKPGFYKDTLKYLDWVTGAFLLIPTTVYKKTKGFDEKIFMYAEELELCFRIKKLGLDILYYPKASIVHLGGQSAGAHLSLPSEIKGIKYFFTKHYPSWQLPLADLLFKLGSILRYIAFGIILKDEQKAKIYKTASTI